MKRFSVVTVLILSVFLLYACSNSNQPPAGNTQGPPPGPMAPNGQGDVPPPPPGTAGPPNPDAVPATNAQETPPPQPDAKDDGMPVLSSADAVAKSDCKKLCQNCNRIVECEINEEETLESCTEHCMSHCKESRLPKAFGECIDQATNCSELKKCFKLINVQ